MTAILHRYVGPETIRIWGHCEYNLFYLDKNMVQCFRVEDKKLIFLYKAAIRMNLKNRKRNYTNPKEGLNLDNATICEVSASWSYRIDIHTFLFDILVKLPSLGVEKLWENTWR